MCLHLIGNVLGSRTITTKNQKQVHMVDVLAQLGKRHEVVQVANFSGKPIPEGPTTLSVTYTAKSFKDRAYVNWATYDGVVA